MKRLLPLIAALAVIAVLPATAGAAATTSPATNVTSNSATLNGVVNANKKPTTYYFQYGTTTAYGTSTATKDGGSSNSGKTVSENIAGLAPGTVYHFRLVATSAPAPSDFGNDMTFTTLGSAYTLPGGKGQNTVTIAVVPTTVRFGRSVVISGQITGPKNAGVQVTLQQNTFPFTGPFKDVGGVAAATTTATGNYTFTVKPGLATRYQVAAKTSPPVTSAAVQVRFATRSRSR